MALSKLSFTPVKTSKLSLPACLTESKAPAKSPSNTFLTAVAKNPSVSKRLLKRSVMLSFIAMPKSTMACLGSLKIPLK